MNYILGCIFKNKAVNFTKLLKYGFMENDGNFHYETDLVKSGMRLHALIDKNGEIDAKVIDPATNEPFTLIFVENAAGAFVGEVRAEYETIMTEIAERCFDNKIFKQPQTEEIIAFIRNTYGDELEFLWEKFTDNAVWRRKDNRKWYGVILTVQRRKLGIDSDGTTEILDVRINPEDMQKTLENEGYYAGYHMNKKHWITVLLDGTVKTEEIFSRIKDSHKLAKKK